MLRLGPFTLVLLVVPLLVTRLHGQAMLPQSGYFRNAPALSTEVRAALADQVGATAKARAIGATEEAKKANARVAVLSLDTEGPAYPAYTALVAEVDGIPGFLEKATKALSSLDSIESVRRRLTRKADDLTLGLALLAAVEPLVREAADLEAIVLVKGRAGTEIAALTEMANRLPASPVQQGLFPVRTTEQAQCFWARRGGDYLTGALLTTKDDRGAIGLAVIEDYLWPVRIALNTVVAASETGDTVKKNVDRLLAGGGNAVLGFAWPIAGVSSRVAACPTPGDAASAQAPTVRRQIAEFSSEIILAPRLGLDLPALGTAKEKSDVNMDFGVDARVYLRAAQDLLAAFAQVRLARVYGSDDFYRGLNLDPADGAFGYGQTTVGVIIQRKVTVSGSFPLYAPTPIKSLFRGIVSISFNR